MKFLILASLALLAVNVSASGLGLVYGVEDDGQWHGEGLWESQDHESARFAPAVAYSHGFHPVAPLPIARSVVAPYSVHGVPVAAHPYQAVSITGPSGHIQTVI